MKRFLTVSLVATAALITIGCGANQKKIDDAELRIKTLAEKGAPDSITSRAKVFLYQAQDAKKRGQGALAKSSAESLFVLVDKAEQVYGEAVKRLTPSVTSRRKKLDEQTAGLTGMHATCRDSLVAIVDSLIKLNNIMQADAKLIEVEKYMPDLLKEQELSKKIRKKVIGTWKFTDITTHSQDKTVHAVEDKIFSFPKNGKGHFIEKKKGKSSPFLKEDWRFDSWGKWDVKGDTIHLLVNRFKVAKYDIFDYKLQADGKTRKWVKNMDAGGTYDSTITDGSQNRFIVYKDLLVDFKKSK